jgi:hypothetical protein
MILMSQQVIVFLFLEALTLAALGAALIRALPILRHWDFNATTARQYRLEKRAYLVVLVILFALVVKILLLPFFAHTMDRLALIVPGAMCAAGVLNANGAGPLLLVWKLGTLFLAGLWLIINEQDLRAKDHPHFRAKMLLFVGLFALVLVESVLDWVYLTGIPTLTPVQCCSTIYGVAGTASTALPLGLTTANLLQLFVLFLALVLVLSWARYAFLTMVANGFFLFFAYHAVVEFFGTYVYQLPTHKCPFCLLQPEYFLVGYVLWGLLFTGVFFGMAVWPLRLILGREPLHAYRWNMALVATFTALCGSFVLVHYLRHGVFL